MQGISLRKHNAAVIAATLLLTAAALFFAGAGPAFADEYKTTIDAFSYGDYQIPAYDGDPSEPVNENLPAFTADEMEAEPFVYYSNLDELGRCQTASSMLSQVLMPTWDRGKINTVYPSGWIQKEYDVISGKYLYNRCHLIGWQLAGADLTSLPKAELAKDLITGTKYLNVGAGSTGMVGYENEVAAYLKDDPENEVAYRVTPVFEGENLVAYGVLMEAKSVASNDIEFCAFCYNVQPEIAINYATGESRLAASIEDNKPMNDCQIQVGAKAVYTGAERKVVITVTDGEKTLTEGLDYETVWKTNTLPGKASVSIVGVGSYRGTVTCHFIIVPARAAISKMQTKKDGRKALVRVAVKAQKGVSGYQYAWRQSGKAKWKTSAYMGKVRVIKKLKPGKVYQVRIRAYKTIDGKKWYGAWSKVKKIRARK